MLTSEFSAWLSARKTRGFRQWVGNRTPEQAWDECDRADWLLWWAAEAGSDFDTVLRCTCACVRRCISVSTDLRIPAVIEAVEAGIESLEDAARNAALVSYEATGRGLSGKAKAAYAAHLLAIAAIDKKPERFAEAVSAAAESLAARYAIRERAVAEELNAMCARVREMLNCPLIETFPDMLPVSCVAGSSGMDSRASSLHATSLRCPDNRRRLLTALTTAHVEAVER